MSKFKRVARVAAGAILATGLAATAAAPVVAATDAAGMGHHQVSTLDTGWGG
ncbi:MAG TPA: hypothetical protein VHO29_01660 [Marmoricola sp.]|nr:hypothetical protein [Marmoricola sp.]